MLRNPNEEGRNGLKVLLYDTEEEISQKKHVFSRNSNLIPMFTRLKIKSDELSEEETALYDRQIRVWGVDAQRRLSKSHVFVSGMTGAIVEFCKNIVLAGVGNLTINDDRPVTEELLSANFLIPPDENVYHRKCIAELCCDSLKELNPTVHVFVQKGDLLSFSGDFFEKFGAAVVSHCSRSTKISVNEKCRSLSKHVAFYAVDCRGSCAEIFVDLNNYVYFKEKANKRNTRHLEYSSFQEAISVPWRSLSNGLSKVYLAMRVIELFEEIEGRNAGEISIADFACVQKLRTKLCESLNESEILDSLLERLLAYGNREFSPVCTIVGGILGQEVIKAISGKGDPIKNFFFFDAMDGKGITEDTSTLQIHGIERATGSVDEHVQKLL